MEEWILKAMLINPAINKILRERERERDFFGYNLSVVQGGQISVFLWENYYVRLKKINSSFSMNQNLMSFVFE